jgi:hypothetical protein
MSTGFPRNWQGKFKGFRFLVLCMSLLFFSDSLLAHEVRPAYLRIQQTAAEQFDVLWRVPAMGEMRLGIYISMPEQCETTGEPLRWMEGGTFVERWSTHCSGGLVGQRVTLDGLSSTFIDALGRYERLDGTYQVVRLTPSEPSFVLTETESLPEVARTYGWLGVEHILLGIDHLLFVLALLLLVPNTRSLFWTITAFTLAHSLTLGAATMDWVQIPQAPVEAVIALSILFVAILGGCPTVLAVSRFLSSARSGHSLDSFCWALQIHSPFFSYRASLMDSPVRTFPRRKPRSQTAPLKKPVHRDWA